MTIPSPTGKTRLYATIGFPVAQVKSPEVLNTIFAAEGIDAIMLPFEVKPEHLHATIEGLKRLGNLDGMLVTVPHKFAVVNHVDVKSEMADLAGSVNALRRDEQGRWVGENFDGRGFVAGLIKQGYPVDGRSVVLVGTGGAGVAIAPALLDAGASRIRLVDIEAGKALALASRLRTIWPDRVEVCQHPSFDGAEIVVNATPLGLRENDPLPFDPNQLAMTTLVADIIMKPAETPLLREAAKIGLKTHAGIHMLTEQIGLYRGFFRF